MNENDWDQLYCSYFGEVCLSELAPPLGGDGFVAIRVEDHGAVIFKRSEVFMEIGYEVESSPNYTPTLVVGIGDSKYGKAGKCMGVPLWFVMTDGEPSSKYPIWKFSTRQQLQELLRKLKSEVLDRYARPLWLHIGLLETAVRNFQEYLADVQVQGLERSALNKESVYRRNAVKAFTEKDYLKFVDEMSNVSKDRMTPVDLRRLDYALRKIGS